MAGNRRTRALLASTLIAGMGLPAAGQMTVTQTPLPAPAIDGGTTAQDAGANAGDAHLSAVVQEAGDGGYTAEATAFRDGLRAALTTAPADERVAILDFYTGRGFDPFWTEAGMDHGTTLAAAFAEADGHGLPPARYAAGSTAVEDRGAAGDPAREAAAMRGFVALAGDLASGILVPARVDSEINVAPERPDTSGLLRRLEDEEPGAVLAALAPGSPSYRALRAEKARLEALRAAGGWGETVPIGSTLQEGDTDPRVPLLRARLGRLGYGTLGGVPGAEERFDPALLSMVKRFQAAHGLLDDGVVGPRTYAAVNAQVDDRIAQVLVNLERLRWAGNESETRHILVNIPAYEVTVFDEGAAVYTTRAVVGQAAETQTPEFSDRMTHLVVNPTWYIPDSIAKRVYLPQLSSDPGVLARNNMRLFTRSGTEIDPGLVDFASLDGQFPFRVRQNPSASNALGAVKFMFPNQFAIYLHDTPARELFDRDARAFSNGCVRLERPFELAHYLLADQLDDPETTFQGWVDAGSERYVNLDAPIDVHIVYRTAWAEVDGRIAYREDVYGRDAKVFTALEAAGVSIAEGQG